MPTSAISAEAMVQSFGANTHIYQGVPAYTNASQILNALNYLGIKDIREGATADPTILKGLTDQGIRVDALYEQSIADTLNGATAIASLGPIALRYIEGPNEINNEPITYNGTTVSMSTTYLPAAQLQANLYRQIKANPILGKTPVIDLTDGGAEPDNAGLQYLTIPAGGNTLMPDGTKLADIANVHVYPQNGDQAVMSSAEGDTFASEYTAEYGQTWGAASYPGYTTAQLASLPRFVTELGFANTGSGTGSIAIDEAIGAKHGLNMMFDAVQRGYAMSYFYELADEATQTGDEAHYGLFRSDYSPKPIAVAIHNLNAILADNGAGAVTAKGSLPYTIAGMPSTASSMLLAKSSGALDIAIWNEPVDWNPNTQQEIQPPGSPVTVNLGGVYSRIEVFDPLRGSAPIQTLTNVSQVALSLGDGPLIVQVEPNSSSKPPPAPSADGTKITGATSPAIIDGSGNAWTLVQSATQGLQIAVNGAVDEQTSDVTLLEILKGNMVQENVASNWYSEPGPAGPWTQIANPTTVPSDVLTLHLAEDYYKGNAQFIVKMDGKQIAQPTAVTALNKLGQTQDFTYQGAWGSGLHKVEVDFINDAYGGSPSLDRNLYVKPPTYDGVTASAPPVALYRNGAAIFTVGHT